LWGKNEMKTKFTIRMNGPFLLLSAAFHVCIFYFQFQLYFKYYIPKNKVGISIVMYCLSLTLWWITYRSRKYHRYQKFWIHSPMQGDRRWEGCLHRCYYVYVCRLAIFALWTTKGGTTFCLVTTNIVIGK
jgi:hypothetical protein